MESQQDVIRGLKCDTSTAINSSIYFSAGVHTPKKPEALGLLAFQLFAFLVAV
jgi:hypothetical protein